MVQVLPEAPSFGQAFGRAIGGGLSHGIGKSFRICRDDCKGEG